MTPCTEPYLARRTPSSGGLANPGRVGAALRSLGISGGGMCGEGVALTVISLSYGVVSDMLFLNYSDIYMYLVAL